MKLKQFSIILIVLLIQSCCLNQGKEIGRVFYTVDEKAKIPYADDQNIDFITNEDFQFSLNSTIQSGFNSDQDQCEDYTSFEYYSVNLNSELPTLAIQLNLLRHYTAPEEDELDLYMAMEINTKGFYYDIEQPLESIEINGTTYADVYRYNSVSDDSSISEVFFNETIGIIKINYTNGDYVQINS